MSKLLILPFIRQAFTQLHDRPSRFDRAWYLVFIAMCHHRLGDTPRARTGLADTERALAETKLDNGYMRGFMREARALIKND